MRRDDSPGDWCRWIKFVAKFSFSLNHARAGVKVDPNLLPKDGKIDP